MWVRFRGQLITFISSLPYLLIFVGIFFFPSDSRYDKALTMAIISVLSLLWAIVLFRRVRLIEDTLSTTLNSAAQGYAELEGQVSLYENEVIRGIDLDLPPMVWHRANFSESSAGFILDDGNGRCTIDPRYAEVITPNYSYNHWYYKAIYPGETIYALGQLETLKKHHTDYERVGFIQSKIIQWKQNQYNFLDYFDKNKDGKIDDAEMAAAKIAAERTVDSEMEHRYQAPATHVVSHAEDGRPFILSSIHPDELLKRYKIAIGVHLFAWLYLSLLVLLM